MPFKEATLWGSRFHFLLAKREKCERLLPSLPGLLLWFFHVAKRKRKRLLCRLSVDLLLLTLFVLIVWPTTPWCENTTLWKAISGLSVSYLPLLESARWSKLHHSYWKTLNTLFQTLWDSKSSPTTFGTYSLNLNQSFRLHPFVNCCKGGWCHGTEACSITLVCVDYNTRPTSCWYCLSTQHYTRSCQSKKFE